MGTLLLSFFKVATWLTSAIGLYITVDKFFPDKLPAGVAPLSNVTDITGKINWIKVGFIVLVGAVAIMLTRYIGKKLNVSILK